MKKKFFAMNFVHIPKNEDKNKNENEKNISFTNFNVFSKNSLMKKKTDPFSRLA